MTRDDRFYRNYVDNKKTPEQIKADVEKFKNAFPDLVPKGLSKHVLDMAGRCDNCAAKQIHIDNVERDYNNLLSDYEVLKAEITRLSTRINKMIKERMLNQERPSTSSDEGPDFQESLRKPD